MPPTEASGRKYQKRWAPCNLRRIAMPRSEDLYSGRRCREALGKLLAGTRGGSYRINNCYLLFPTEEIYAAYSGTPPLWFYGIARSEWQVWPNDQPLAFILKDVDSIHYALLNPNEAQTLLGKCYANNNGQKKMHIRRPANSGQLFIVEWNDLRLSDRLKRFDVPLV